MPDRKRMEEIATKCGLIQDEASAAIDGLLRLAADNENGAED